MGCNPINGRLIRPRRSMRASPKGRASVFQTEDTSSILVARSMCSRLRTERLITNQAAGGSNPPGSSNMPRAVAAVWTPNPHVPGSNPGRGAMTPCCNWKAPCPPKAVGAGSIPAGVTMWRSRLMDRSPGFQPGWCAFESRLRFQWPDGVNGKHDGLLSRSTKVRFFLGSPEREPSSYSRVPF